MMLRNRLTLIVIAMMALVIAVISFFILHRFRDLQIKTTYNYAMELARAEANDVQRRMEEYTNISNLLALLFGEYESTPENLRRDNYDDILSSTLQRNTAILGIWTAWLPSSIDSRDAELGQYQSYFTRRYGYVERIPEGYEGWRNYLLYMTDKPALTSPVWREVAGYGEVPVVAVMYPIRNENTNELVGLVGINHVSDMDSIINEVKEKIYDGKGVAGVFSNDGTIVSHFDRARIKDNFSVNINEKETLGNQHDRVIRAIKNGGENGKPVALNRYSAAIGSELHIIYQPINISGINTPWCLMIAIPMNEIDRPVRGLIYFVIIFAVIILVLSMVITFFMAQRIVSPILGVTHTLKDISEGEGDLTREIIIKSKDEIGSLAHYFNLTLEKIKKLIINIKFHTESLSDIGGDLASNMTETATAINEITANIQSIKSRVLNQSASVSQTNATMEQVLENINKLNGLVEKQSSNVSMASTAIEEMAANIQSVNGTLLNNAQNVKSLQDASEVGRSGLQDVAVDIQGIARESEGLLEINAVMENIASQTNLLSMNAAIEAAHAGEAGRGFAVVADEIRKLAESSGEQSKTISSILKKIKTSIDKITMSTENVLTKFEAIDSNVKIVADQEEMIRRAMDEQGAGSEQIVAGVVEVSEITRQVKNGSREMLDGSKEVISESKNLETVTQEISGGMSEMAAGADQINVAVVKVNELSEKNRQSIDTLVREVSRFKVD